LVKSRELLVILDLFCQELHPGRLVEVVLVRLVINTILFLSGCRYHQQKTVYGFAPGMFGISAAQMGRLSDDRIGRAL